MVRKNQNFLLLLLLREDFQKNLVHFSICACHPCAGAMLIFSVSFQFYRMIPEGNPVWCEKIRTSCCFFCFAKTSKKNLVHFSICAGAMLIFSVCHPCAAASSASRAKKTWYTNLCVSSLRRGHANLLCIVPILSDDPRRESGMVRKNQNFLLLLLLLREDFQKNLVHFSICACHPCAGAMLIFSVSFQFYRMIPEGNPVWCEKILVLGTLLDLCMSSLRRGHANLLCIVPRIGFLVRKNQNFLLLLLLSSKKTWYTSRFVRVILAQGPC